ncbi:hypothetical protein CEX93_07065 [Xanthomonas euvesicatoria]|nr:hypothetical protein BJD11_17895 [Xanthomonas euvesicatoria]PPU88097.1 hypothetical protein XaclCFBP3371_12010 [Xanthomonas euvesicatoria pv. citrumelonis]PWH28144.1 hypothetical protein CEX93_07065 [Xanthomonas euvesicatoria]
MKPHNAAAGVGQGDSAAADRLLGPAHILSGSPSRHIRVPLSANPRSRCRLGAWLPWPEKVSTKLDGPFNPLRPGVGKDGCAPWVHVPRSARAASAGHGGARRLGAGCGGRQRSIT